MYCQKYKIAANAGRPPLAVSRRLSDESEVELKPTQFGQPVDIELALEHGERALPNMPGYPRRSVDAALGYIHYCFGIGLRTFLVRIVDGGDQARDTSFSACLKRLERQCKVVQLLRDAFPEALFYIDPFGLALGEDDQWGATTGKGVISLDLTERMFTQAVQGYATAGASYILTLGRFAKEVLVARRTLDHMGSATKICCFSTNTETTQAYAYLSQQSCYHDSQQKVLPQNVGEMILWGLVDIACGANQIIIKPSDNLHVLLVLMQLAQCPKTRKKFFELPTIQDLLRKSEFVEEVAGKLLAKPEPLVAEWGSYAISGIYAQDMVIRERKGEAFLLTVLFERFVQISSTAAQGAGEVTIFDRNAAIFMAAE
jgi:delta-aminolevulinic acid dehydratase/porphobilinogen synthase